MNDSTIITLCGTVVTGDGRGRTLGFPTANVQCQERLLPADGIYAALVTIDSGAERFAATASIGTNPTFAGERPRRLEVHLHDVALDLYGCELCVMLIERLREMETFAGSGELVAQSRRDVERCRRVLAARGEIVHE